MDTRYESIFADIQVCILILDARTLLVLDANPAACRFFGARKEDLTGRPCHAFLCSDRNGTSCPANLQPNGIHNTECVAMRESGERSDILKSVVRSLVNGQDCFIESFVDITPQKRLEQQLRTNLAESNRMNQLMMDRELRILDLKKRVNELQRELGRPAEFQSPGDPP